MSDTYEIKIGGGVSPSMFASLDKLAGGLTGLNGLLEGFSKSIVAAFGGLKLAQVENEAIAAAGAIGGMSKILGSTVEQASGLDYVAKRSGTSLDALTAPLIRLSTWLVKNGEGSKSLTTALIELSEEYKRTPEGPMRLDLVFQRLGRSGKDLIPILAKGPEEIRRLMEREKELGSVTDEQVVLAKQWSGATKDFHQASEALWREIGVIGLPRLISLEKVMTDGVVAIRKFVAETPAAVTGIEIMGRAAVLATISIGALKVASAASAVVFEGWASLPLAIHASALSLAVSSSAVLSFAGTVGALAAAITACTFAWQSFNAEQQEAVSVLKVAEANNKLAVSLSRVIEQRRREGQLSDEQARTLEERITNSSQYGPQSRNDKLRKIGSELIAEGPTSRAPNSIEELNDLRRKIDLKIEETRLDREINEATETGATRDKDVINSLNEENDLIKQKLQLSKDSSAWLKNDSEERRRLDIADQKALLDNLTRLQNHNVTSLQTEIALRDRKQKLEIDELNLQRAMVQANFRLTDSEQRAAELKLLDQEADIYDRRLYDLRQKRAQPGISASEGTLLDKDILNTQDHQTRINGQQNVINAGPNPDSLMDQIQLGLGKMKTLAQEVGSIIANTIGNAIHSVATGISGLIMGTMTWAQALRSVATTILTDIITSIVEMALKWVAMHVMMAIAGKAIAAAATTALLPIAAAQAEIWATPATLSAIASYGASADVAPLEIGFAIMEVMSSVGFAEGGYTGDLGTSQVAGVVHGREFVIPANRVDEFGAGFFEQIRQGEITPADVDGSGGSGSNNGSTTVNAHFAAINTRQEMRDFMAQEGVKMAFDYRTKRERRL